MSGNSVYVVHFQISKIFKLNKSCLETVVIFSLKHINLVTFVMFINLKHKSQFIHNYKYIIYIPLNGFKVSIGL